MELISSTQNPKVKLLQELQQKSSERRKLGLFVVEGRREVERCLACGYEIDTLFFCPEIYGHSSFPTPHSSFPTPHSPFLIQVTPAIYDKVAYRGGTEGVIAEVKTRQRTLSQLSLSEIGRAHV